MSPWPFVTAAYAATMLAVAGLIVWAYASMRRSEAAADSLRK
jgi:heme exporter protein CcmD